MKKFVIIAGAVLAIPFAFTLLLKAMHLLQGLISKLLSALLWCLSLAAVLLLIRQVLTRKEPR